MALFDALLIAAAVLAVVAMLGIALWSINAEAAAPSSSCAGNPPVATVDLPDGSIIRVASAVYFPSERRIVLSGADCVFGDGFES
jgi:hypothetical protein